MASSQAIRVLWVIVAASRGRTRCTMLMVWAGIWAMHALIAVCVHVGVALDGMGIALELMKKP